MKDIRIITGQNIRPSIDTVIRLLGCKNSMTEESKIKEIFHQLYRSIQMRVQPKAALVMDWLKQGSFPCAGEGDFFVLYVMLTIGGSIGKLIQKYEAEHDMLRAMTANAMADSCLFAFEEQLLPAIRQLCLAEGFGIARRFEIPTDIPMEMQKTAYDALNANRTLGISMTSGYMLDPVKSMCLMFELTKDTSKENLSHHCETCTGKNCPLKNNTSRILLKIETLASARAKEISCERGSILLHVLQNCGIALPNCCSGKGTCGKCGILVKEGYLPVTSEDKHHFSKEDLKKGARLACKASLQDNISIILPEQNEKTFSALGSKDTELIMPDSKHLNPTDGYGIAIDIGTTTLAFSLLDLKCGKILSTHTTVNSQRMFGADVISRIQASNNGNKERLQKLIQQDLWNGLSALINKYPAASRQICHIAISANTVMLHLLRGYSCRGFCRYPFSPKTLALEELSFEETFGKPLFSSIHPKVSLLPGISAFVGADITAGLYACDFHKTKEITLFIDLGTNGEMALLADGKIFAASTAAGPVFEGGNITFGMGSLPGAISQVSIQNEVPKIRTINNEAVAGICGTGVIEAAAELFLSGITDKTGKLSEPYFQSGYPLAQKSDGTWIFLTQKDIREIQMAKAAIRAGIEILILRSGIRKDEISQVFLAGGFGYFLNIKKAAAIGILPKDLAAKTTAEGNTALKGTLYYLAEQKKSILTEIVTQSIEIPLANDEKFQEMYLKYMSF